MDGGHGTGIMDRFVQNSVMYIMCVLLTRRTLVIHLHLFELLYMLPVDLAVFEWLRIAILEFINTGPMYSCSEYTYVNYFASRMKSQHSSSLTMSKCIACIEMLLCENRLVGISINCSELVR